MWRHEEFHFFFFFYNLATKKTLGITHGSTQSFTPVSWEETINFPALPGTKVISFRDAKPKMFPGNRCLNFMWHETRCLQEWCLISTATVVTSRKANFTKSHMAASLMGGKQDETKGHTFVMAVGAKAKSQTPTKAQSLRLKKKKGKMTSYQSTNISGQWIHSMDHYPQIIPKHIYWP